MIGGQPGPMGLSSPLSGLRLLLPAILPSWRFFDTIAASPRLDFAVLAAEDAAARWQPFRPRPAVLTPGAMLRRLLWNAQANEDLFLVSLAERLMRAETQATMAHSQRELLMRVARHLDRQGSCAPHDWLRIRLRLVRRAGAAEALSDEVVYVSDPFRIAGLLTP